MGDRAENTFDVGIEISHHAVNQRVDQQERPNQYGGGDGDPLEGRQLVNQIGHWVIADMLMTAPRNG